VWHSLTLVPDGFFDGNPALELPSGMGAK
jgi:hypothetical protein